MTTEVLKIDDPIKQPQSVQRVGDALREGLLAAIPTETVYGLAANAFDEAAVRRIFEVKGRPQDNPLIVHISSIDELYDLVTEVPQAALKLAESFWPGPLTMVLKRSDKIPPAVSAGLDTVAVRMPSHEVARAIIRAAGVPLAAPSANLSGSPSPTSAQHCIDDLFGRVPFIVDSGESDVGVESTVVSLAFENPVLLRPGGITAEQLSDVLCTPVALDSAVKGEFSGGKASSPGMKYKHYSPNARVTLVKGDGEAFAAFVNSRTQNGVYAMCFDEDVKALDKPYINIGSRTDGRTQAKKLFAALRRFDEMGAQHVFAHCPDDSGVSLAVYNRLLRSAAFDIITL